MGGEQRRKGAGLTKDEAAAYACVVSMYTAAEEAVVDQRSRGRGPKKKKVDEESRQRLCRAVRL